MPKLRVHSIAVSLDGFGARPDQSLAGPLGVGGGRLHDWPLATRAARQMHGVDGGELGIDDDFISAGVDGIGATIMGRDMLGPIRGPWGMAHGPDGGATIRRSTIRCSWRTSGWFVDGSDRVENARRRRPRAGGSSISAISVASRCRT